MRSLLPLLIVAVAAPSLAHADDAMSAQEVKQVLTDNTAQGSTSRGTPYWLYRRADGTQALETDSGFSDEGEWSVKEDGTMCSEWKKFAMAKSIAPKSTAPVRIAFTQSEPTAASPCSRCLRATRKICNAYHVDHHNDVAARAAWS
ncbi:MAG: DUF995 domain-containing protein [Rhodospirillaceae bacterium]|nr:DUF995 domain-containing protein [Rhodospirillaceae bacterium]